MQQNADAAEGLGRWLAHRVERGGEHFHKVVQLLLGDVEGCLAAQRGGDEAGAGRKGEGTSDELNARERSPWSQSAPSDYCWEVRGAALGSSSLAAGESAPFPVSTTLRDCLVKGASKCLSHSERSDSNHERLQLHFLHQVNLGLVNVHKANLHRSSAQCTGHRDSKYLI